MPTSLRRRLRLARRGLWYVTAVTLVLVAVAVGIVSQLLPLAERHPDKIAEWLSARAGREVRFDGVETAWTRRGPLLRLDGLRVGDGEHAIPIGAAEILVSQYAGILPGRSFTELRVRNLELNLQRADDGRWQVRGLPGQAAGGDPLGMLEGLGELQVIDARLGIDAPSLDIDTVIPDVDLRVRVNGNRVRAGVNARMRADDKPIDAVLDFDRRGGDGRIYAAARDTKLAQWAPLLQAFGVRVVAGEGRVESWAVLRERQVASVSLDVDLQGLQLRGAMLADQAATVPQTHFAQLDGVMHWRAAADGWRMDAPRLQVQTDPSGKPQMLDGLMIAGGQRYGLKARRVDAAPLFAVAVLSNRLDDGLRRWLSAAKPGAVFENVVVTGARGAGMRAAAQISDLHFDAVGTQPGVRGLAGQLHGDHEGAAFVFDPQAQVRYDWPRGFGVPHVVRLRGEASVWREGAGWRVETPALRIDGQGYGANARGGLWFQNDGTRPAINLAVDLDSAAVPIAKRFWPKHWMGPGLVSWLDTALVSGTVQGGRALVSGDLDDWPFKTQAGRPPKGLFDARATLHNATIKFQHDWPAATAMHGDVVFAENGFKLVGKAVLGEVGVHAFEAGIVDYAQAELKIDASADADAAKLLALLKQSPLQKQHGQTMRTLTATGPTSVNFGLRLPFFGPQRAQPQIQGDLRLRGVRLSESEWKLAFAQINGQATFDQHGFAANALHANYDRQDSRLSLRAGQGHVRDAKQGFEAELEAAMTTDDLLARARELSWLKPHLRGRSRWSAGIGIPLGKGADSITRLRLRSDLVGTALALPAPMDKAAGTALPTTVDLELPLGKGEVALAFGQRLALRARQNGQNGLGVRAIFGTERVTEPPPTSGLILTGRTGTLNAIDWIALLRGDDKGGGLPLRRIDTNIERLQLLGANFPDTRLQVVPTTGGLAVQLDGTALAGGLIIPDAANATINGRLQRLHWRAIPRQAATSAATVGGGDIDPSRIPPLNLRIDDLRVANAALGDTQFRSRPNAGAMEIQQLQMRAPKRRIDLTGDWSGRSAQSRTRLQVAVTSEDFGGLIADLGGGKRVDGGKGEAKFEAMWPGSPMAFQLGALEGRLKLDVKGGRLIEVEPGAGRVLGLLSIAELPRRLTLDFRDFFNKGFAFNTLAGTVRFSDGAARSDDLVIDGPAAQINIRGAANLRTQTYDQTIEVQPKAGNLLTAVGAIAGGPVGAAVGAVANAVLQKPIGQITAKNYRVTGPWREPKVEVIERANSKRSRTPPG